MTTLMPGQKYRHYKTEKNYEVMGVALHSETQEELVIYKALYLCEEFGSDQLWARPKEMFLEHILYHGNQVPRFKLIEG